MMETCATSFAIEMPVARSRTATKNEITLSMNDAMRGTMTTMAPTMTNRTTNVLRLDSAPKGGSSPSLVT
jgi:hypothetical protein